VFPGSLGREIPIRGKLPVDDLVDIQGGLCGVLTPETMVEKGLVGREILKTFLDFKLK
jgi:hypothetical protein